MNSSYISLIKKIKFIGNAGFVKLVDCMPREIVCKELACDYAIVQAARYGIAIDGATLYQKMTPCYVCAKMIINAGIKRVVVQKDYHAAEDTKRIFKESGVKLEIIENINEEYEKQ